MTKVALVCCALTLSMVAFIYGLAVGLYKIAPYETVLASKKFTSKVILRNK